MQWGFWECFQGLVASGSGLSTSLILLCRNGQGFNGGACGGGYGYDVLVPAENCYSRYIDLISRKIPKLEKFQKN